MRAHLVQHMGGRLGQRSGGGAIAVPAVKDVMHRRAAPCRGRVGIQRIKPAQPQNRLRIELIGVGPQPVERGHGNIDPALVGRGVGLGARVRRHQLAQINIARPFGHPCLAMFIGQFRAQHRLDPQHKARGDNRPADIAPRPA